MTGRAVTRLARLVVLAISLGVGVAYVILRSPEYQPADVAAYWEAGMRLRSGEPLYMMASDRDGPEIFRYAPWFAMIWVPLTFLPMAPVVVVWWLLMIAMALYLMYRIARLGAAGLAIVGLIGPYLIWIAGRGNVHPLLLLSLVLGVESRAGPLVIGLTASLKATPLAYALVYLGRGQLLRFVVAVSTFGALSAPMILFGWESSQADPGRSPNPIFAVSPLAWFLVVVALSAATVVTAHRWPRYAWVVASAAAVAAVLRFLPYSVTYLLVGLAPVLAGTARNPRDARGGGRSRGLGGHPEPQPTLDDAHRRS